MADQKPEFRHDFDPRYGKAFVVADGVQRLTAANKSPFTFTGTNSYIIGNGNSVGVVDPGPGEAAAPDHLQAWLNAIGKRKVSHIFVTHTHRDHTGHVEDLRNATGAPVLAFGPHKAARELANGEVNFLDAAADYDMPIDQTLNHGETIAGDGWALEAVFTPGHAENHLAFGLQNTDILFSGDHVMGWATTIVAPPDGHMGHYMQSLETLLARPEQTYLPGHGARIEKAHKFIRGIRSHRRMRETAIFDQYQKGKTDIMEIVRALYADVSPALHGAAALSVQAHIEHLVEQGKIEPST